MTIRFIQPKGGDFQYKENYRGVGYPKLTFPIIAGYSGEEVEHMEIIDEEFEQIDFDVPVDLAAITVTTSTAHRAYEIADMYRRCNVAVVLGGTHVSSLPAEALRHADSVVIGEGEDVWPLLIKDFCQGRLKPVYRAPSLFDMKTYRQPRLDLLKKYSVSDAAQVKNKKLPATIAQFEVSRGCPFACEFCSVTSFYGYKFRFRPLDNLLRNIRDVKISFRTRAFGFIDDNLNGDKNHFVKFLQEIGKLNIGWSGQVNVGIVNEPKTIKMMAHSGCRSVFVGFESLSPESLSGVNKKVNLNRIHQYQRLMDLFAEHKIVVVPSFIFGLDGDKADIFEKTFAFLKLNNDIIAYCYFNILTPLPGTNLYKRMLAENRIIEHDWRYYNFNNVVIKPLLMSADTLKEGFDWIGRQFNYDRSFSRDKKTGRIDHAYQIDLS